VCRNIRHETAGDLLRWSDRVFFWWGFRGLYGLCCCFFRTQQRVFSFLQAMIVLAPSHGRSALSCGLACVGFLCLDTPCGWLFRLVFQVSPPFVGVCLDLYGESGPDAGPTPAAGFTHPSRAVRPLRGYTRGKPVSNTCVTWL